MKTKHPDLGDGELLRTLRTKYGLTQAALAEEIGVNPFYVSRFENSKPVSDTAREAFQQWIQAGAA